jgi:hypothetical protein
MSRFTRLTTALRRSLAVSGLMALSSCPSTSALAEGDPTGTPGVEEASSASDPASDWTRERRQWRREKRRRFLEALPESERKRYEAEALEIRRLRESYDDISPEEREALLEKRDALRGEIRGRRRELRQELSELPPEERRALYRKLRDFRELPESEQQALRERYRMLRELSPEEREQFRANAARWRAMSPEERDHMREQLRRLRGLPPEERRALIEELRPSRAEEER